jgi:hypothetical protein
MTTPPPHFFSEVRILKGLGAEIMEVRILKDLAKLAQDDSVDFKGVRGRKSERLLEVRILKGLEG